MAVTMEDLAGLTAEQVTFLEQIRANIATQLENQLQLQTVSLEAERERTLTTARLQCVQVASTVLASNALTKPADESEVTPEMISNYANTLMTFVVSG